MSQLNWNKGLNFRVDLLGNCLNLEKSILHFESIIYNPKETSGRKKLVYKLHETYSKKYDNLFNFLCFTIKRNKMLIKQENQNFIDCDFCYSDCYNNLKNCEK